MSRIDMNPVDLPGFALHGEAKSGPVAKRAQAAEAGLAPSPDDFAEALSEQAIPPEKTVANPFRSGHRAERHHAHSKSKPVERQSEPVEATASSLGGLADLLAVKSGNEVSPEAVTEWTANNASRSSSRAAAPHGTRETPRAIAMADTSASGAGTVLPGQAVDGVDAEIPSVAAALPFVGGGDAEKPPLPVLVVDRRTDFVPAPLAPAGKANTASAMGGDSAGEPTAASTPTRSNPEAAPSREFGGRVDFQQTDGGAPATNRPATALRRPSSQGDVAPTPGTVHAADIASGASPDNPPVMLSALPSTEVRRLAGAIVDASPAKAPAAAAGTAADAPLRPDGPIRTLTVQLHPVTLGVVTVHMTLKGDQLFISLRASREDTARLLREDQDSIARILNTAGYRTEIRGISLDSTAAPAAPASQLSGPGGQTAGADVGGRPGGAFPDGDQRGQRNAPFIRGKEDSDETVQGSSPAGDLYV